MISTEALCRRRNRLIDEVGHPILLMGNGHRARNLPMSPLPFRQDSSFLYFTGCHTPGAAALLTPDKTCLYLPVPADDDHLWHGPCSSIDEQVKTLGFDSWKEQSVLEADCRNIGSSILSLAVPDDRQTQRAAAITGLNLDFNQGIGPNILIEAVIRMRRILDDEEFRCMRQAATVTAKAHRWAMAVTRPGVHEAEVTAIFDGIISASGLNNAYNSIVTVDGHILHNYHRINRLKDGQLMLLDGGAEARSGHATDVTRTWPVSGKFNPRQRAAYLAVLSAQQKAIELVRPGTRYRDVHRAASLVIAQFLVDEGLLRGTAESCVESGAHAPFFPHGIGHLIGLDVHDLENFGDRAAYPPERNRPKEFGACYLRLDLDLSPGMAVTIEPGIYMAPSILRDSKLMARFGDQINVDRVEEWLDLGGIRIEDDVAVTKTGHEILTPGIPKEIDAVEALVGTESLGCMEGLPGLL